MKPAILEAKRALSRAYAPYSDFKVGAAIELKDGSFVLGANIENASYGLANCAERSALYALYSQGYQKEDIVAITIIADHQQPVSPCGACRQVMHELMPASAKIFLANLKGEVKETSTNELLPYAFVLKEEQK